MKNGDPSIQGIATTMLAILFNLQLPDGVGGFSLPFSFPVLPLR
jgi:hypothetical protein